MSNNAQILKLLEYIGIRGYEAKAYLALIELGEASATTIASKASIPQPRVYEVLESLLKKGLIEVKIGRPRTYRALPPNIALNSYVERYVSGIYSNASRLVSELSKHYLSESVLKEPLIWINYSLDTGIEKVKKLIVDMKYDGFISADPNILGKIVQAITKKMLGTRTSALAITLIADVPDERIIKYLETSNRIEVRLLPTGIVKMVEVDLTDAMIFGENYVIHSREREVIIITYEVYYFGYWRVGKVVKPLGVNRGMKYTLKHHWLALDIASRALEEGLNVKAYIEGIDTKTKKTIAIKGYIRDVRKTPGDTIRALIVETGHGDVSVGGLGATIEDVEATYVELELE